MTHLIEFSIPVTDVISANGRDHHMVRARKVRHIRKTAELHAQSLVGRRATPLLEKAHVTVSIGWQPLKRTRDADNLSPTVKAAVDGFTDAGIWPDDSDKHRLSTTYTTYSRSEPGLVWLRFELEEVE